jgi:glycosyltransferase involved in cell wall biosynthesis
MKKIAIFIDSLAGGGAERVMLELAKGFKKRNFEVVFIIRKKTIKHSIDVNLKLICLDDFKFKPKMKRKDYAKILKKVLESEGPFKFILSNLESTDKIIKLLKLDNVYFVIHNTISQKLKNRYKKKSLKNKIKFLKEKIKFKRLYSNENIITVSEGVQKDLLDNIRAKPKFIKTIYNPFDFKTIKEKSKENIEFKEENYIINIARFLLEQKRQDILLKAYKLSGVNEKLVLMGEGPDKKKIIDLIDKLDLKEKVIVLDFQKNPYPYLKKAKLFVLSSDYEGLPTVMIESLSLGVPAVSTDCPSGPREILKDMPECLVPVGNVEKLSEKIKTVKDNEIIKKKVQNVDLQKFDMDYVINEYLKLGEYK